MKPASVFAGWCRSSLSPEPAYPSRNCGNRTDESGDRGNRADDRAGSEDEEATCGVLDDVERFFFGGLHGDVPFWVYRCSVILSLAASGLWWSDAADERANWPAILTPSENVSREKRRRSCPSDSIFPERE